MSRSLALISLIAALLAFSAVPAIAQDDAVEVETLEQALPTPTPDPCRTPDADYTYGCAPCPSADADYQTEADYAYCTDAIPSGTRRPRRAARRQEPVQALPAAATLPLTGSEPRLIGLMGLGLLFAGAGLRLRTAAARTR